MRIIASQVNSKDIIFGKQNSKKRYAYDFLFCYNGLHAALISVIILFASAFVSFMSMPKYDFVNQYISELGTSPAGFIFNYSIILSAFLFIPFYIFILKLNKKSLLFKIGIAIGLLSCLPLALIGVFTGLDPYHTIVASFFFFMVSISTLIISFYLKSNRILAYELCVSVIGFIFGLIHYTGGESQLMQKFVASGYLLWFAFVSIELLRRKKRKF